MNDKFLHQYCLDWVKWCESRCFYMGGKPEQSGAEPGRTGLPPDARNSADMQYFNMAVHMLSDMKEFYEMSVCFKLFYVRQADHVKREADKLGICRRTYYYRTKAFAKKALSMAQSIKGVNEKMRGEDSLPRCASKVAHLSF